MRDMMKFSIVIPEKDWNYFENGEPMKWVLHSLFETNNNYYINDVVIVDDYSSPENFKTIKKYLEEYNKIKIVKLPFGNIKGGNRALVRNYGAFHAELDDVLFLDADTAISSNLLEMLHDLIQCFGEKSVFCFLRLETFPIDGSANTEKYKKNFLSKLALMDKLRVPFKQSLRYNQYVCTCKKLNSWGGCDNTIYNLCGSNTENFLLNNLVPEKHKFLHTVHRLFVSNCFYANKNIFLKKLGGISQLYWGWGEEDLDFAQSLKKYNVPFYYVDSYALSIHYPHPRGQVRFQEWIFNLLRMIQRFPSFVKTRNLDEEMFFVLQTKKKEAIDAFNYLTQTLKEILNDKTIENHLVFDNSWDIVCRMCRLLEGHGVHSDVDTIYKFISRMYQPPADIEIIREWNPNI